METAETADIEFKKPTLIGKIGKLPRKLKQVKTNKTTTEATIEAPEKKLEAETVVDNASNENPLIENSYIPRDTFPITEVTNKTESTSNSYKEPSWSKPPDPEDENFSLEVIKSGVILETVSLNNKAYWSFGRLPECDIVMAHPTISRYHAVLQFHPTNDNNRVRGWYIYDQNSTHGTFLNKTKLLPLRYVFVKPGFILKFGGSTRNYILMGGMSDYEENEMTITDMINKKKEMNEAIIKKEEEIKKKLEKEEQQGIDWGMGEDADEETDLTENPYAMTNNEELFLDDPKKTLRGFFEREGLELVYDVEDRGAAHFTCRIELPVDNANGKPIIAEYSHHGKKKEVVVQCALEACRILDRLGMLRQSNHEPRKRKFVNSDSDEDDFLDRTGDIERKRLKKTLQNEKKAATHEELLNEEKDLLEKICAMQSKLACDNQKSVVGKQNSNSDILDNFMSGLTDQKMDNITKRKIMFEIKQLQENVKQIQKLIRITTPNKLPELKSENLVDTNKPKDKKNFFPLFGKRPFKKLEVKKLTTEVLSKIQDIDERDDEKDSTEENIVSETSECKNDIEQSKDCLPITINESEAKRDNVIATNRKDINLELDREERDSKYRTLSCDNICNEEMKNKANIANNSLNTKEIVEKNKKNRNRFRNRTKDERSEDNSEEIDQLGDKYNTWVPPKDQTGDGKTKLNEKFGY